MNILKRLVFYSARIEKIIKEGEIATEKMLYEIESLISKKQFIYKFRELLR